MAILNSLRMNNPLSAKIHHLDCFFRITVPYITIRKGLRPALSSLLVPSSVWSTKPKLDHTIFIVTKKKTTNYHFSKVYSACICTQGSHNLRCCYCKTGPYFITVPEFLGLTWKLTCCPGLVSMKQLPEMRSTCQDLSGSC